MRCLPTQAPTDCAQQPAGSWRGGAAARMSCGRDRHPWMGRQWGSGQGGTCLVFLGICDQQHRASRIRKWEGNKRNCFLFASRSVSMPVGTNSPAAVGSSITLQPRAGKRQDLNKTDTTATLGISVRPTDRYPCVTSEHLSYHTDKFPSARGSFLLLLPSLSQQEL